MKKQKILKILMAILDVILIPLIIIQLIGGNINITAIMILIFANVLIFTNLLDKKKGGKWYEI